MLLLRRRAASRLIAAIVPFLLCGGCAVAGGSFAGPDRQVELEMAAAPTAVDIKLMVSNGEQADEDQYQTTLIVESDAAPGFSGGPGFAGVCSGVLLAKDLVLTAAHCMCMQPIRWSVNKALNRADCATRALVKKYVRTVEKSKDGGIKKIIAEYPQVSGFVLMSP